MRHDFWTGQDSLSVRFDELMEAVYNSSHGRLPSDIKHFMAQALTTDTKKMLLKSKLSPEAIAEIMIEVGIDANQGSVEPVDKAVRKRL